MVNMVVSLSKASSSMMGTSQSVPESTGPLVPVEKSPVVL